MIPAFRLPIRAIHLLYQVHSLINSHTKPVLLSLPQWAAHIVLKPLQTTVQLIRTAFFLIALIFPIDDTALRRNDTISPIGFTYLLYNLYHLVHLRDSPDRSVPLQSLFHRCNRRNTGELGIKLPSRSEWTDEPGCCHEDGELGGQSRAERS